MASGGVYLKRFDSSGESKMDLTAAHSESGSFHKQKTCTTVVKVLSFVIFLALAVAIAACIAVAVVVRKQDEMLKNQRSEMQNQNTLKMNMPPSTTPPALPIADTTCMTPECVVAASRIYQSIDATVHPCDDFFTYACGNWVKKHPIPDDQSSVSKFSVLGDELNAILKDLLKKPSQSDELIPITKAKKYYKSCVNEDLIEERGLEPLSYITTLFGEWPLLNDTWNEDSYNLEELLIKIRTYGTSPIIYQGVSTDLKNSTRRLLEVDQPSLIMPGRDYYLKNADKFIPALRKLIKSTAMTFGATDNNQVDQDVEDVIQFEIKIANLTIPDEARRDLEALYNKFTIKELYTNISNKFDWLKYNQGIMSLPGVEINITEDDTIIVYSPVYLKQVFDLIEVTPKRTVVNYIMATELKGWLSLLPKNIRNIRTEYRKVLYGTQTDRPRWKTCISSTNSNLGNAMGRLFVDEAFDEDAKAIALDMIGNIREAFNGLLDELDWMDEPTRKVAIDKAAAMKENIGYSDKEVKNDTALEKEYKDVEFNPDTYFENVLMNSKQTVVKQLKKLHEPVDKSKWQSTPAVVNAFYSSTRNDITFPAGILQPPFFSKHYPKSMNFGGIGLVIGHEITHGFDDRGRGFDKNGDLVQWWSEEVIDRFKEKARCIVEQYGNYTVPEADMKVIKWLFFLNHEQLNGINTQGENIADNGGFRQSFTAYRNWVKRQGKEEQQLPGLDFTPNQLYFLNFAQVWCTAMRPQSAVNRILTGVHSPGQFRVTGVLQNSEEFTEAFNCPKTSYMNPPRKCKVW